MTTQNDSSARLSALAERVLDERWKASPPEAASSGIHAYDGQLPPVTRTSIETRLAELRTSLADADSIAPDGLAPQEQFDRDLLLLGLRSEIWELSENRSFSRDPMALMWPLEATAYMDRSYAPVEQRMASMANLMRAVPAYLESARALLEPPFAKPVLHQAIEAYSGVASYYRGDVAEFAEANLGLTDGLDVMKAAEEAAEAIDVMVAYLRSHESTANDDFALGAERYATMLSLGEMVDIPLAQIEAAGESELRRHQASVREAAERIAPGKPLAEAIAVVTKDHPAADKLIDETREMLEEIRSFTIDHDIASVISEVRAQVRETPAFMRWAFAAMDGPGPFEEVATESFYYVTPVEKHWTPEQSEEWLSNFGYATLKIISIHEAYPGHYVHFLRHAKAPSAISKVFGAYSFWEGWATTARRCSSKRATARATPSCNWRWRRKRSCACVVCSARCACTHRTRRSPSPSASSKSRRSWRNSLPRPKPSGAHSTPGTSTTRWARCSSTNCAPTGRLSKALPTRSKPSTTSFSATAALPCRCSASACSATTTASPCNQGAPWFHKRRLALIGPSVA